MFNSFCLILIIIAYTIIGFIIGRGVYVWFDENLKTTFKATLLKNIIYLQKNKIIVAFLCGAGWLPGIFFALFFCLGNTIYNKLIDNNEEDRTAAWFV